MTDSAVQVQRADAGRFLGHGRSGDRLLRPLQPVLRPRARRVPRTLGLLHRDRPRRVRDARERRRVLRPRPLRRRARDLRPGLAFRAHEHHLRVRRLPGRRTTRSRSPPTRRSSRRPRRAEGAPIPRVPDDHAFAAKGTMSRADRALGALGRIVDPAATPTTSCDRPSSALHDVAGYAWAGIFFVEGSNLLARPPRRNARQKRIARASP